MAPSYEQEIAAIREWISKEEYLPQNFDDAVLRMFLHSCYGSLEQTKRCIEKCCVSKCSMPEIYTKRDPLSPRMQTAFSIAYVSTLIAGNNELIIYELNDPELENFHFNDILKLLTIFAEYWILTSKVCSEGHIIIMDIKHYFLKMIPKCDLFLLKQFIVYLLEAMPVRIRGIHLYNCPSYYETFYAIVKPFLPQEVRDQLHFHFTMYSLQEAIGKKFLPLELGGEGPSMKEINRRIIKDIETSYRSKFQDDNFWKADLTRRTKSNTVGDLMIGSFKTLDFD